MKKSKVLQEVLADLIKSESGFSQLIKNIVLIFRSWEKTLYFLFFSFLALLLHNFCFSKYFVPKGEGDIFMSNPCHYLISIRSMFKFIVSKVAPCLKKINICVREPFKNFLADFVR